MGTRFGNALLGLTVAGCVGCDQVAKRVATSTLSPRGTVELLGGLVHLRRVENPGAFLSMGAHLPGPVRHTAFVVAVGVVLAALLAWALGSRRLGHRERVALGLLVGGGLGNLVDRLWNEGRVVDFVSLGIGSLRTGVFNLADGFILAGGLLLVARSLGSRSTARSPTGTLTPRSPRRAPPAR